MKKSSLGPSTQITRALKKHESGHVPEVFQRVLTFAGTVSGVTGTQVGMAAGSGIVTSCTEFSSMAVRFQEFRPIALKVRYRPRIQLPTDPAIASIGQPIGCVFTAGIAPAAVASFLAAQGFRVSRQEGMELDLEADWGLNPTAKLWNGTQASVPANQQFGLEIRHPGLAAAVHNGVVLADYYLEVVCQFRSSI